MRLRQQAELQDLRSRSAAGDCPSAQCTIADVRKMQPNDPFVQNIKRLVDGQEPPFTPTLREMSVRIAVVGGLGASPAFNICRDTLEKLNEGVEVPNPNVQLARTLDDGSPATVKARRAGRIGEDVCSTDQRDFDIQVNCPVALALFQTRSQLVLRALRCAAVGFQLPRLRNESSSHDRTHPAPSFSQYRLAAARRPSPVGL